MYEVISLPCVGGMALSITPVTRGSSRDVALKVWVPAVADDPDRLARFSREARLPASLNAVDAALQSVMT